jgi:hypothetical protein
MLKLMTLRTFDDQVTDFIDFFVKDEIGTPTAWAPETAAFLIQFGINDIVSYGRTGRDLS